MAAFVIYQDTKRQWRWRLRAGNGEIIAHGESYTSHRDAKRGVDAVRRAAAAAEILRTS